MVVQSTDDGGKTISKTFEIGVKSASSKINVNEVSADQLTSLSGDLNDKTLLVVIDDFSSRVHDYDNTTLYDYGLLEVVTYIDNYTNIYTGQTTSYGTFDDYYVDVPDYTGGLTFDLYAGNFEMTMMWYWSVGNEIFNQRKWFTDFFGSFEGSAKGAAAFNSWTPELGNNAAAPIWESASNLSTNGASNSWYVEDGSFARLQMLSLAYNFDRDKIEQFGLSKLKLGVSANNVWTITGYEGLDPMVAGPDTNFGIDVGNFPVTPSYLFNLELGILGL